MDSVIEKFQSDEKAKVGWLACIYVGVPAVRDKNWILRDESYLHEGYKAARILKGEDNIYKVVCEIGKTLLGLPSFSISAYKVENTDTTSKTFSNVVTKTIRSLKITTASNNIIEALNVQTKKRWSGLKFFGLDRTDFKQILHKSAFNSGNNNNAVGVLNNQTLLEKNNEVILNKHGGLFSD